MKLVVLQDSQQRFACIAYWYAFDPVGEFMQRIHKEIENFAALSDIVRTSRQRYGFRCPRTCHNPREKGRGQR